MRLRVQQRSTIWAALTHALLFHTKGYYSKREQHVRVRKLQKQVTNYICDWKRNGFRIDGFQPGQGGAATIEEYCWALKTNGHAAKSNCQLELQAFGEIFNVRVVCYDASSNRPDWKSTPWRSSAAPSTIRIMRNDRHGWCALYPAEAPLHTVPLGRSEAGAYGSCQRTSQCPTDWDCKRHMCVPTGEKPPALPPL